MCGLWTSTFGKREAPHILRGYMTKGLEATPESFLETTYCETTYCCLGLVQFARQW